MSFCDEYSSTVVDNSCLLWKSVYLVEREAVNEYLTLNSFLLDASLFQIAIERERAVIIVLACYRHLLQHHSYTHIQNPCLLQQPTPQSLPSCQHISLCFASKFNNSILFNLSNELLYLSITDNKTKDQFINLTQYIFIMIYKLQF